MEIIEQRASEYAFGVSTFKPFMNVVRLKIMHDNMTEMKVTLTDLW